MFVTMVLDNIFALYTTILQEHDCAKLFKFTEALALRFTARECEFGGGGKAGGGEAKSKLKEVFSRWLPISQAVLGE